MIRWGAVIAVFMFLSGCSIQEGNEKIVKETIVKEPTIVNNERTFYIEVEKEPCPQLPVCPACPKPALCQPCKPKVVYNNMLNDKIILGEVERVYFPGYDLILDARIDTGAKRSSMHAENIVPFERDGKKWVRFDVLDQNGKRIQVKKEVVKKIRVKQHNVEGESRYVVKMRINIATLSYLIELSLTNRKKYEFPVLIGRNYLKGNAIVDVTLKHTTSPLKENK